MPATRKPLFDPIQMLVNTITTPRLDESETTARLKGGLAGVVEGAANVLLPDPFDLPIPMMAAGKRAAKGLVKGIQGFELPGGRVARPDAEGVHRIIEGDQALENLKQMQRRLVHQTNRESGFVPSVAGPSELSDVAVPIPDSLDTEMAHPTKLLGAFNKQQNLGVRRTNQLNESMVRDLRDRAARGYKLDELYALHPEVPPRTIYSAIKGHTWNRVK